MSSRRARSSGIMVIILCCAWAGGAAIAQTTFEQGVDRRGDDYNRFVAASARDCAAACQSDQRCRAFTYVLPNTIQGSQGQCWLKASVPPPAPSDCCVSGIKVTAGGDDFLPSGPGQVEAL